MRKVKRQTSLSVSSYREQLGAGRFWRPARAARTVRNAAVKLSPHSRGCTASNLQIMAADTAFPALAGMHVLNIELTAAFLAVRTVERARERDENIKT